MSTYEDEPDLNSEDRIIIHEHDWVIVDFEGGDMEICEICHVPRFN